MAKGNGKECVLFSGSIEQSRIVYRVARDLLEPLGDFRFTDSANRVAIYDKGSTTRLRAHGSNPKTAFGLSGVPLVILDEPGALNTAGGELLWDAIKTAQGKPGSRLRAVLIGTLAPASIGGWWDQLVSTGSNGSTHVTAIRGSRADWSKWKTIKAANPLVEISDNFKKTLLEERDAALMDSRLKARFLSYRLNIPTADEAIQLLTIEDVEAWLERPVPEPKGRPIVALDLGESRAWSAAVATWQSGRVESFAFAPGVPDLAAQEKRDGVPRGEYQRLVDAGSLETADGLQVPPVAMLWQGVKARWGIPANVICDRFKLAALEDVIGEEANIEPRVTRWSEGTEDIEALRRLVRDGPFALAPNSRALLVTSLSVAKVQSDDSGSSRLVKAGTHNTSRDDAALALSLAAGAAARASVVSAPRVLESVLV